MSAPSRILKRSFDLPRRPAPPTSESTITVDSPTELTPTIAQYPPMWVWMVVFIVSLLALLGMLFVLGVRSITNGGFIFLPMMAVSMFMMFRGNMGRGGDSKQTKPKLNAGRAEFLRNLDTARTEMHAAQQAQVDEINWHHPDPLALGTLAGTARMWERHANAPGLGHGVNNFGHARIGLGATRTAAVIVLPKDIPPRDLRETVSTVAVREFGDTHQVITGVPRPLDLFGQPIHVFITKDDRDTLTAMFRAVAAQAATFHRPDELLIAVVTDLLREWEPIKWLPHAADPDFIDKSGSARLVFATVEAFVVRFGADLAGRGDHKPLTSSGDTSKQRMLVIIDDPAADPTAITGATGKDGIAVIHAAATPSKLAEENNDRVYYLQDGNLLRYFTPISDWETA